MKCPYCNTETTKKPLAVGVYYIYEADKKKLGEGKGIPLRLGDNFLPIAMHECNHCNFIFFTPARNTENLSFIDTIAKNSKVE